MTPSNFQVRYQLSAEFVLGAVTDLPRVDIQALEPIRRVQNYRGQTHMGGWYYFSKMARHIRYESGLERLRLMFLDHDPEVSAVAAQPFSLTFMVEGKAYSHVPDLLVVRPGQARRVEDVKPSQFVNRPNNQLAFGATRTACDQAGLAYTVWSEPSKVLSYNICYLVGYRRPPVGLSEFAPRLLELVRHRPQPLGELVRLLGQEYWARPVLYHLVWIHQLSLNLEQPLSNRTLVAVGSHAALK